MTKTMLTVAVDEVVIDDDIDFRTDKEAGLDELAASIEAFGLMQPITVAPANGDGKYHIVAGRRRLRAIQALGWLEIDAIIDDALTDADAQIIGQVIENLQRQDVSPLDEARGYQRLATFDMTQKDIAASVGVSTSHVSGRLALLKLPEQVVAKVVDGKVSVDVATKLARLPKAVRDAAAHEPTLDARTVSRLEADHKDRQARTKLAKAITDAGVPAVASSSGWGYQTADEIAAQADVADDAKPKSHEWTTAGYVHRAHFDSDDDFVAAIVADKAKAAYLTGSGANVRAMLVGSANLTKERKAEEEDRERLAEERRAATEARIAAFDQAIAPLVASPDKGRLVAGVLTDFLTDQLSGYGDVLRTITTCAERVGLTLSAPDLGDGEGGGAWEEIRHYRSQVLEWATQSTANLMKAIVASQMTITPLLIDQGMLDHYQVEHATVHAQLAWLEAGHITEDRLSEAARAELAERQAADVEADEFEARLAERVEAEKDRLCEQEDHDEDFTDAEIEAIRDQLAQVLAMEDEEAAGEDPV